MAEHKLACVRWSDAHGNALSTYEAHEVPHAPAMVRTYGVVIRHDATGITIAGEVFEAGSFRSVTFIPAGMIADVSYYHAPRSPRRRRPKPLAADGPPEARPAHALGAVRD